MLMKMINANVLANFEKAQQALWAEIARDKLEQSQTAHGREMSTAAPHARLSSVDSPYLSVKEVAALTRLSPSNVRLLIRRGKLPAQHVGRRIIIKREDLQGMIENAQPTRLSA
jgi:excisionase family DNA binding protein